MSQKDRAEREAAYAVAQLAGLLVGFCNRARATKEERADVVHLLVTLGFDDSDEEGSTLEAIERGPA
jgi:hypothetical protein